ncbi:ABC transporter permease [Propionivibrio sp.]|uniref:ABC transporter permease n=1 Tax=Propionivibrio sp. TaxID=2212460 RepID=UPI0039E3F1D2
MTTSTGAPRFVRFAGTAALCGAGAARAAAGLHQATVDSVPEMLAAFGVLRGIGEAAVAAGFVLWLVPLLLRGKAAGLASLRVAGALCWVFGAASTLFGALPDLWRASLADVGVYAVPAGLFLLSLLALSLALGAADEDGDARWGAARAKPGFALATSGWLAFLIVFVAVPIACAWSLAWSRGAGGAPGIGSLLGSRYWSLGCVTGRGACGSAVNSIALGIAVSAIAGLLGSALALYVHRAGPAVRRGVAVLACLPMITPPFLVGFGLAQVFGKAGIASVAFEAIFGTAASRWFFGGWGVLIAQVLVFFPLAYFMVLNALDALGRAQIDAAKFLGASDGGVLRTVALPALRDPLAVAVLVIFVETLSDVGNPLLIGGRLRVLSTELFYGSSGELAAGEMAGAPALLIVAIALGMTLLKGYLASRAGPAGALPADVAGGRCELPAALRWTCGGMLGATIVLLVLVYAMIGIGAFSEGGKVGAPLTLDNFARGFGIETGDGGLRFTGSGWESFAASLLCAFLVAPVGSAVGMLMVWILGRVGAPAARLVDGVSSCLLSIPSVVIGAGFMLAFGGLGLSNAGAWAMILLAMLIRNLAACLRFGSVALRRVERAQLEMSGLFGAGSLTTFRRVVAPALRPVFLVCAAYGFVRSMTMLGSVLLLSSAENQVATTYMIDRIGIGEFGVGMAYGVVLAGGIAGVLGAGALLVSRSVRRSAPGGWRAALSDLKAAVVIAQKGGVRG